jgi:hypothetical protein
LRTTGRVLIRLLAGRIGSSRESRFSGLLSWVALAPSLLKSLLETSRSAIKAIGRIPEGFVLIFLEVLEEAVEGVTPPAVAKLLTNVLRLGFLLLLLLMARLALEISPW